jgi:hypothetical protein
MRHLRWANQLLWSLAQRGLIRDRGPALQPGRKVPTVIGERERQLREGIKTSCRLFPRRSYQRALSIVGR